jgi:hypothetical protein
MSRESTIRPPDDEIELEADYQSAFEEWRDAEDAGLWDGTVGDGLAH